MAARRAKLRFTLFPKILVTMLAVALVPLGIHWYVNYAQSTQEHTQAIHQDIKQRSAALVHVVDAWIDTNFRVMRQNAAVPEIVSMEPARQLPILITIANTYEWLIGANVVNLDGMPIARSDGLPPVAQADREWFKQVLSGKPFGKQVLVTRATGKPGLALAVPIQGPKKALAGVLMMNMHLTDVSQAVANVKIGKTGFTILLDETGHAIAHGRPEMLKDTLQDMRTHPALQVSATTQGPVVYEDQGKRILAYTQKTQQGWTLITQQHYDEAFLSLAIARRNGFILLISTVVLFSGLAYILSKRLATPIRQLTATAEKISLGKWVETVGDTERGDEIGALARAIDRLGVSQQMALTALRNNPVA